MAISRRNLILTAGSLAANAAPVCSSSQRTQAAEPPSRWTLEADVVVVGSGASGFPAAIVAREAGNSVIMVEAQPHTGGHGICSGGNVPLGGGTQPPEEIRHRGFARPVFRDLTDWSVVEGEWLSRLPLQRPRSHPRVRRPQRRDFRFSDRPWRRVRRQGARHAGRRESSAIRCRARTTPR